MSVLTLFVERFKDGGLSRRARSGNKHSLSGEIEKDGESLFAHTVRLWKPCPLPLPSHEPPGSLRHSVGTANQREGNRRNESKCNGATAQMPSRRRGWSVSVLEWEWIRIKPFSPSRSLSSSGLFSPLVRPEGGVWRKKRTRRKSRNLRRGKLWAWKITVGIERRKRNRSGIRPKSLTPPWKPHRPEWQLRIRFRLPSYFPSLSRGASLCPGAHLHRHPGRVLDLGSGSILYISLSLPLPLLIAIPPPQRPL